MSNLYSKLAKVYEIMYPSFIDYQDEFDWYGGFFKKYEKQDLLELGCGTGELARLFTENDFQYTGIDQSSDMLILAQEKVKGATFLLGDMRQFQLEKDQQVDGVLMAGRTISYLLTNEDVKNTIASIRNNLTPGGILCFDFIDANAFIPKIDKDKKVMHSVVHGDSEYIRESRWEATLVHGMDFSWNSKYFEKTNNEVEEIGEDHSTIRTFTKNEIEIFLQLNHFKILELHQRPSYAFPTYVVVAQKEK